MSNCECVAVDFESNLALEDVRKTVCRYGMKVYFHGMPTLPTIGDEPDIGETTNVERDKYGSIINRNKTVVTFCSYPIDMAPSTKQLQNVGMVEQMDVILYLSSKEVENAGYIYSDFDTLKTTVTINNVEYKVKDRRQHSHFKNVYLYIALGLRRN